MIRRLTERLRRGPVHVACACDEAWMPHCATMVRSLLEHRRRALAVHLLTTEDVPDDLVEHLEAMIAAAGCALDVRAVGAERVAPLAPLAPAPAWHRLLLPELLAELDRVLYLDCDVIATGPLDGLWRSGLDGSSLLAGARAGRPLDSGIALLDLEALRGRDLVAESAGLQAGRDGAGSPIDAVLREMLADAAAPFAIPVPARHFDGAAAPRPWEPRAEPASRDLYWRYRGATPWIEPSLTHPMREFFNGLRHTRREHYATRPRERGARGALLTIVHNEPLFLPIWLRYYSRFYAPEDIYVLDHETDDGSTSGGGFTRIPVRHRGYDAEWVRDLIAAHQEELLGRYDSVLVADADEIIAPDPGFGTLGDYVARFDEEYVNCLGYEVLHLPDEPPFERSRPVLAQRRFWFPNDGYDKPALVSTPIERVPGLHSRADRKMNLDPDLRLIHLHRLDYGSCFARHRARVVDRSERDLEAGRGVHLEAEDEEEFRRWFYEDTAFDEYGIHLALEPIPDRWKALV